MRFDFSWSPARPQLEPLPRSVHLPADALPIIAEAGRILRETSPQEEFVLRGMGVRLDRPEGATAGRIAVLGVVEGQPRRVFVDLGEADYHVALQAHQERQPISCTGEWVRDGRPAREPVVG